MELRHLRYFVAVAEEGSLTLAATRRLFTAQPSLSRQIKDLEDEVGTQLFSRSARGIELTPAGRAFLDHARLALAQVEAASEAARRAAEPSKPVFGLGFLTGQEMDWLPHAMHILGEELPHIEVTVTSQYSPQLAQALLRRKLDVAFMREEAAMPDLVFDRVASEELVVVLPMDHRLAGRKAIAITELAAETLIGISDTAPTLKKTVVDFLRRSGFRCSAAHEADNLAMAISLVASTQGVALLPAYAKKFLPATLVSRPIKGDSPRIDLVVGYHKANKSETLRRFVQQIKPCAGA
jgi:LysR family hca operon transcriptional activator